MTQPEMYRAAARIDIELAKLNAELPAHEQAVYDLNLILTEFDVIQSETILGKVIQELDLNREWGRRYGNRAELRTSESMAMLRSRLDLRRVPNTVLIDVRFVSEEANEAAKVANTIADVCAQWARERPGQQSSDGSVGQPKANETIASGPVIILERAAIPLRPMRPTGPLRVALALASLLTGVVAIGFGVLLFRRPLLTTS